MLPSSNPNRGNYHGPGEAISKIVFCVASDGNACQSTEPVLALEEISSPGALSWRWSPASTAASRSFSLAHRGALTATWAPTPVCDLEETWCTTGTFLNQLKVSEYTSFNRQRTLHALGRHLCHFLNSLMVRLYICICTHLPLPSTWMATSFPSLLGAEKACFWAPFVFHRPTHVWFSLK